MKYNEHIRYIDTDGIKLSCKLEEHEVGKGLGKMKYEGKYKEAVFIAPKVYGGILEIDRDLIQDTKVKGLKDIISY
jgi:hypothetical protein